MTIILTKHFYGGRNMYNYLLCEIEVVNIIYIYLRGTKGLKTYINKKVCNAFDKNKPLKRIFVLGIMLVFIMTSYSVSFAQNPASNITRSDTKQGIIWDVSISFQESGGKYDSTVFGEAPDASDGSPVDTYDTMKPPPPITPYLYAWFNDSLPAPYDKLTKDYRHYPGITKSWRLFVQWVPTDYTTPTIVTMKWDSIRINSTEYDFITLTNGAGESLKNMRLGSSYSFSCPAMVPQSFGVLCSMNHPPNVPCNPFPFNASNEISIEPVLRWSGGDPDYGDVVTYDIYFGTMFPLTKIAANQSEISYTFESHLLYNMKYYWKIVAWDTSRESKAGPLWWFTTKTDATPPTVTITQPRKGFFYVNIADTITRKLPIFFTTFVVGKIDVTVTASDTQSGINRVEFYIDNELKATDVTAPYAWVWLERGYFFPYILRVNVVDCVGLQTSVEIRVWKVF